MDWFSVGVAAACGAIAGVVSSLVGKGVKNDKSKSVVVGAAFAITFGVLYFIAKTTVITDHKVDVERAKLEELTAQNPAFQAIAEYAPEKIQELDAYLEVAVRESHSPATIEANTRSIVSTLVAARLSQTSDEALINAIDLVVDQLEWLYNRGDDTCFKFLHPAVDGGITADTAFSQGLMNRDFESTRLILSGYDPQRPVPGEAEASPIFTPLYLQLIDDYGQQAVMELADVTAPGIDRRRVCQVSIDLYKSILDLPQADALTTLRWMLSGVG